MIENQVSYLGIVFSQEYNHDKIDAYTGVKLLCKKNLIQNITNTQLHKITDSS